MRNLALWMILIGALSCQPQTKPPDYERMPAFTEMGVNAVIEIPAGTNHKIEYDKSELAFKVGQADGKDRIIDFLPYPGNYGFIPSTHMDPERGGDGDALDILVICESQPTGTVLEVRPIAALLLEDEGERDTKIIAIPTDTSLQVAPIADFQTFSIDYDGARHIIETWFMYYDGLGTNKFMGWKDEHYAMSLIEKWSK
jgi:inorganic pyrophosphatase